MLFDHCSTLSFCSLLELNTILRDGGLNNLKGTFSIAKYFLGFLQNEASVAIISSGSALTRSGGGVHYTSSKVEQLVFVRGLVQELSGRRIRVNAICSRSIKTPMLDVLYESANALASKIPLGPWDNGRHCDPYEIPQ